LIYSSVREWRHSKAKALLLKSRNLLSRPWEPKEEEQPLVSKPAYEKSRGCQLSGRTMFLMPIHHGLVLLDEKVYPRQVVGTEILKFKFYEIKICSCSISANLLDCT
jgi:hypothetical protein